MQPDTLVIHLTSGLRPAVVARRTRAAYDEGRDVTWLSTRHEHIRKAAAALDGWQAAFGTSLRLDGEGRTAVVFAHRGDGATALVYWPRTRSA